MGGNNRIIWCYHLSCWCKLATVGSNEGLTLETSALETLNGGNLLYPLSWWTKLSNNSCVEFNQFIRRLFIHTVGERVRFFTHNEWIKIVQANQPWSNLFIISLSRFISEQNSKINLSLFSFRGKQRAVKPPHSSRVALKWLPCKILYI